MSQNTKHLTIFFPSVKLYTLLRINTNYISGSLTVVSCLTPLAQNHTCIQPATHRCFLHTDEFNILVVNLLLSLFIPHPQLHLCCCVFQCVPPLYSSQALNKSFHGPLFEFSCYLDYETIFSNKLVIHKIFNFIFPSLSPMVCSP